MNIVFCPTSIDYKKHQISERCFIRFYSVPLDIFVSMDKKELQELAKVCSDAINELNKKEE